MAAFRAKSKFKILAMFTRFRIFVRASFISLEAPIGTRIENRRSYASGCTRPDFGRGDV